MGIDLSSLLQGLTTAAGGVAEGVGARQKTQRELERQARMDALAQSAQRAAADLNRRNVESEMQRRADQTRIEQQRAAHPAGRVPPRLVDPGTGQVYERNAESGEWEPARIAMPPAQPATGIPATPQASGPSAPQPISPLPRQPQPLRLTQKPRAPARAPAPKQARTVQSVTADGRTVITQLGPDGHPVSSDTLASGRAPTMIQSQAASQLPAAEDAVGTVSRIAATHPESYEAAVRFLRAHRHAKLGGDLIAEARGVLGDADAQRVVQAYNAYLLATIPNARPNVTPIDMESEASLPAAFGDRSTWPDALRMMSERVQALRIRGGRISPPAANQPPDWLKP